MTTQPAPVPHPRRYDRCSLPSVAASLGLVRGCVRPLLCRRMDHERRQQSPLHGIRSGLDELAHDNQTKGRLSSFSMLLAALLFLHFIAAIRSTLEAAESSTRGSLQLARVSFAGGLIGIAGTTMAFVSIANASAEGADANPAVSKAVTTSTAGPFLVGAVGFAALLLSVGVLTLRSGVFSRWTGIVALIGGLCFLITLLTVLNNTGNGSSFGYAFFPALLSLVIWTVATSIARYRAVET